MVQGAARRVWGWRFGHHFVAHSGRGQNSQGNTFVQRPPWDSVTTTAPRKVSPAAVVSTTLTANAGVVTAAVFVSGNSAQGPQGDDDLRRTACLQGLGCDSR
jgi:hypothetical protein